ncbi:MAG: HAD-IA family hydrolase [Ectothiorhodospiraceae bacterium]|nr:HAD-IA family hydrolase [Ectothiorhodospiraceae bacterium]
MQKRFDLLVFDWDGTLMDSEAHIVTSMQRAMHDAGLPDMARAIIRDIIGLGLREAIQRLLPNESEEIYLAIIDRYRYHFFTDDPCEPFEGAEAVLKSLSDQGYLLAVATGKGRRGLDRVLQNTGFGHFFIETRCADETCSKPDPQMLQEIMDATGMEANQTLMIGDTEYDLEMANAARTASVGVDYGVHSRERLLACGPLTCLSSISELTDWLAAHTAEAMTSA